MHSDVPRAVFFIKPNRNFSHFQVSLSVKIVGNMILIASSIIVNYLFLPALPLNSVKLVSSRQMPNSRTRKAGVTGSSPVAGSIAQDSRLRAAFLLPILSACAPIQTSPRQQRPTRWTSGLMLRGGDLPKCNFNEKKPSCNNCHGEGSNWPYRSKIVTIYKCRETLGI